MEPTQEIDSPKTSKLVTRNQLISVCTVTGVLAILGAWGLSRLDMFRIERQLDRIEGAVSGNGSMQIQAVNTSDAEFTKMTRDVLKKGGKIE